MPPRLVNDGELAVPSTGDLGVVRGEQLAVNPAALAKNPYVPAAIIHRIFGSPRQCVQSFVVRGENEPASDTAELQYCTNTSAAHG